MFSITLLFCHGTVAPIPDESPDNGPDAINHLIPDSQHPDDDGSLAVEMMEAGPALEPAMIHFHLELPFLSIFHLALLLISPP